MGDDSSESNWHIRIGEETYLCPNESTLVEWAKEGKIPTSALIWHESIREWKRPLLLPFLREAVIAGQQHSSHSTTASRTPSSSMPVPIKVLGYGLGVCALFVVGTCSFVMLTQRSNQPSQSADNAAAHPADYDSLAIHLLKTIVVYQREFIELPPNMIMNDKAINHLVQLNDNARTTYEALLYVSVPKERDDEKREIVRAFKLFEKSNSADGTSQSSIDEAKAARAESLALAQQLLIERNIQVNTSPVKSGEETALDNERGMPPDNETIGREVTQYVNKMFRYPDSFEILLVGETRPQNASWACQVTFRARARDDSDTAMRASGNLVVATAPFYLLHSQHQSSGWSVFVDNGVIDFLK